MIKIENLKKQFGETIACNIPSFEVSDGDVLGLVGNNGAGKTTLFRMMLDLLKPDKGQVSLNGINPALSEDWKKDTGACIDESFLIDYLTPEEYFAFLGKIGGIAQTEVDNRLGRRRGLWTEEAHSQPVGRQQAEGGHHCRTFAEATSGGARRALQFP